MLVFYTERHESGTAYYKLENLGAGPALNVLVTGGTDESHWSAEETILMPAISQGGRKHLGWLRSQRAIVATYSDILGNEYTTLATSNRQHISRRNRYPALADSWIPEGRLQENSATGKMTIDRSKVPLLSRNRKALPS
jgi:hypothetical protein